MMMMMMMAKRSMALDLMILPGRTGSLPLVWSGIVQSCYQTCFILVNFLFSHNDFRYSYCCCCDDAPSLSLRVRRRFCLLLGRPVW